MSILTIIKPKRPTGAGWRRLADPSKQVTLGFDGESYFHVDSGLFVISAVEVAKDADGIDRGPEYHVSVSQSGHMGPPRRCTSGDAMWVIAAFDMLDAEEDNHVPNGVVRNFWRPVADRLVGIECACKDAEPVMREEKGDYIWRGVTR